MDNELKEELAAYAHDAWSRWMSYQIRVSARVTLTDLRMVPQMIPEDFERWSRKMMTYYDDLPDKEKYSDREEADKILAIFNKHNGSTFTF